MNEERQDRNDLTVGSVWRKLLAFFVPIAAGTCIQQLYNAVDALVVGRFVGTEALAAVGGSAAIIISVLIGFFVSMTSGASVVIAQIYGAGKDADVQRASGNAIAVSTMIGIVLAIVGFLLTPAMLALLQTPEDTMAYSVEYLRIYFTGVPFILALNMESNILRSVGDSLDPFVFMVVGCVSNIILDFVLVLVFSMGVAGVAVATVAAQVINLALLSWKLMTIDKPYRLPAVMLIPNRRYLGSMLQIGVPSGLQSSMYSISNMVVQIAVNTLGTLVVASWAMTSKIDGIYWAVSSALGSAITSFIGQNFGARKYDRVKLCVKQGMILSVSVTVVLSALILLLARPILSILTEDQAVIDTTIYMMYFFVPFYFTWTLIEVLSAVLRGSGTVLPPLIIIGCGICLFRIVWILIVFRKFRTLESLCMVYTISWVITGIALLIYYKKGSWLQKARNRTFD